MPRPESYLVRATLLGVSLAAPLIIYNGTARSIVAIWSSSGTFTHGYAVVPVSLYLAWKRRAELAGLPLIPWWPAFGALMACGAVWALADLGAVQVVRQYALAAMLPLTVLAVLGLHFAGALRFPLLFLLFAVPFGDVLVEPLANLTADFTVGALAASGIPVLREGNHITTSGGYWSVEAACSGVRYLIASLTLGCLFAHLCFRSRIRQAGFILASIVVPIAANAVRAYAIVLIGHLSGAGLAAGVDHVVYGWLFFGAVTFALFLAASRWRDDLPAQPAVRSPVCPGRAASAGTFRLVAAAAVAMAVLLIPPFWLSSAGKVAAYGQPPGLSGIDVPWTVTGAFTGWRPAFNAPSAHYSQAYADGSARAGLDVFYYRDQDRTNARAISSSNLLTAPLSRWTRAAHERRAESIGKRALDVQESLVSDGATQLLVWSWYWIGGRSTASEYTAKLYQARERIAAHRDDAAVILAYVPVGADVAASRRTLRAFVTAGLRPVERKLESNLIR